MGLLLKPPLTAEQYLEIERAAVDRSDFLDGVVIAMPGGSEAHSTITLNIATAVNIQSRGKPFRAYTNDMRVRTIPSRHFTYPDLTIAVPSAAFEDDRRDILTNPAVIFEVLSPSTMEYDRTRKFELYFGVESFREYVLVSQDKVQVDRLIRSEPNQWVLTRLTDIGAVLRLESVAVEIPLAEFYDRVEFPSETEEGDGSLAVVE